MTTNKQINKFCAIDIGSTTTKAFFFKKDREWTIAREETPTTVEKPYEDVTIGVLNALKALEKKTGEKLIEDNKPALHCFATSSAGGGLSVIVVGLITDITSRSGKRTALGAGAIIQEVIAMDDGRTPYKKIEVMRKLNPDMILLAGGFDGGSISGPVFMSEIISQSNLKPKFGTNNKLPLIYAGNENASEFAKSILKDDFFYIEVPNIRPIDHVENVEPARQAMHETFLENVMSQAPGYNRLLEWSSDKILPTPLAVSRLLKMVSKDLGVRILAIDIGGATTDIFSVADDKVVRTVSANMGMSYSILNVIKQAGLDEVKRLAQVDCDLRDLLNKIGNKYLFPTSLPENTESIRIECAVASVAIRQAFHDHLKTIQGEDISLSSDDLSWHFLKPKKSSKKKNNYQLSSDNYDLVIGSGGVLSHYPHQIPAMIMLNGLEPEGTIDLAIDNAFMMPQLGSLSQSDPELALELFYKYCLKRIGKVYAPSGTCRFNKKVMQVNSDSESEIKYGQLKIIKPESVGSNGVEIKLTGLKHKDKNVRFENLESDLILDGRGRPAKNCCEFNISDEHVPLRRESRLPDAQRIYQGQINIKRELAIPGQVHVKEGDIVQPDTLIAKAIKSFQRPFYLDIGKHLDLTYEEFIKIFKKKIGDEISEGEILASRKIMPIGKKHFKSNVAGTIEKILPNASLIVREKLENTFRKYYVDVSTKLKVHPASLKSYYQCEAGQEVEREQVLIAYGKPGNQKFVKSPIRGKITNIDLLKGIIVIQPMLEELELMGWFSGTAANVNEKGCTLSNTGYKIQGVWGIGNEAYGELKIEHVKENSIIVFNKTTPEIFSKLESAKIKGLITGGIDLELVENTNLEYPIIVMEEFGADKINSRMYEIFKANENKIISIDPTTQLRAGVRRPFILIPD